MVRAHLEELFMVGGVDVIIEAHEHSYEVSGGLRGYQCGTDRAGSAVYVTSGCGRCTMRQ